MISYKQFLAERYVTTSDIAEKDKYRDHIHKILKASYAGVGGYGNLGSGSDAEHNAINADIDHPNHLLKLHKKDGAPLSLAIYKKSRGRKLIAAGTNQTPEGRDSLHRIIHDDNKDKRAWGEVSHKMAQVFDKHKMPHIPNSEAEKLTGKKIIKKNPDGTYDREIGGSVHTKRLQGHPKES